MAERFYLSFVQIRLFSDRNSSVVKPSGLHLAEGVLAEHEREYLAAYLISNGVIVLPCNVGDTVYHLYPKQGIKANKVKRIQVGTYGTMIADRNGVFRAEEINKTVFLTREEAENALNDMKHGDKI